MTGDVTYRLRGGPAEGAVIRSPVVLQDGEWVPTRERVQIGIRPLEPDEISKPTLAQLMALEVVTYVRARRMGWAEFVYVYRP